MKKIIWILSCLIILIAIYFLTNYIRPNKIDIEQTGLIYTNDATYMKKTTIKIQGDLYKSLFSRNTFIGELILDGDLKHDIKLYQEDNRYFGLLTSIDDEYRAVETIGSVSLSINFDRTWIQSDEINLRYDLYEGYISSPANTIDEAK